MIKNIRTHFCIQFPWSLTNYTEFLIPAANKLPINRNWSKSWNTQHNNYSLSFSIYFGLLDWFRFLNNLITSTQSFDLFQMNMLGSKTFRSITGGCQDFLFIFTGVHIVKKRKESIQMLGRWGRQADRRKPRFRQTRSWLCCPTIFTSSELTDTLITRIQKYKHQKYVVTRHNPRSTRKNRILTMQDLKTDLMGDSSSPILSTPLSRFS